MKRFWPILAVVLHRMSPTSYFWNAQSYRYLLLIYLPRVAILLCNGHALIHGMNTLSARSFQLLAMMPSRASIFILCHAPILESCYTHAISQVPHLVLHRHITIPFNYLIHVELPLPQNISRHKNALDSWCRCCSSSSAARAIYNNAGNARLPNSIYKI